MAPRLALLALLLAAADAIYFHVQQGQPRCFIEELPGQTLVVATYKNPDFKPYGTPGFSGTGVLIRVMDPAGMQLLARDADTEGRVSFTATLGGEYQVCFSTNSTRWQGGPQKFRIDLKLDVGEEGLDYAEVAKKEHLSELEVEIRKLNDKVKDVLAEQAYQRQRELEFRRTADATHSKQQLWSIFQIGVMAVAAFVQVTTLRRFFRGKKLN